MKNSFPSTPMSWIRMTFGWLTFRAVTSSRRKRSSSSGSRDGLSCSTLIAMSSFTTLSRAR